MGRIGLGASGDRVLKCLTVLVLDGDGGANLDGFPGASALFNYDRIINEILQGEDTAFGKGQLVPGFLILGVPDGTAPLPRRLDALRRLVPTHRAEILQLLSQLLQTFSG